MSSIINFKGLSIAFFGNINGKISLLISNNPRAGAVAFAYENDINVKIINEM